MKNLEYTWTRVSLTFIEASAVSDDDLARYEENYQIDKSRYMVTAELETENFSLLITYHP